MTKRSCITPTSIRVAFALALMASALIPILTYGWLSSSPHDVDPARGLRAVPPEPRPVPCPPPSSDSPSGRSQQGTKAACASGHIIVVEPPGARPIAGALVSIGNERFTTGDRGEVSLPFGAYEGSVEADEHPALRFQVELRPDRPDATVELEAFAELVVKAVDEDGAAVGGVDVLLVPPGAPSGELRRGGFGHASALLVELAPPDIDSSRWRGSTDESGRFQVSSIPPAEGYRIAARAPVAIELDPPFEPAEAEVDATTLSIEGPVGVPRTVSGMFALSTGVAKELTVRVFRRTVVAGRFDPAAGDPFHSRASLAELVELDLDQDGVPDVGSHRVEAISDIAPDGSFRFEGVRGDRDKEVQLTAVSFSAGVAHVYFGAARFHCESGRFHDLGTVPPAPGRDKPGRVFVSRDGRTAVDPDLYLARAPESAEIGVVDILGPERGAMVATVPIPVGAPFVIHGLEGERGSVSIENVSAFAPKPGVRLEFPSPPERIADLAELDLSIRVSRTWSRTFILRFPEPIIPRATLLFWNEREGLRRDRVELAAIEEPTPSRALRRELGEGRWQLLAHTQTDEGTGASYFAAVEFDVAPDSDGRNSIDVAFEPASAVRFRVNDATGAPRESEAVALGITDWPRAPPEEVDPVWSWDGITDAEGIAVLRGVPPFAEIIPAHAPDERIQSGAPGTMVEVVVTATD